MSASRRAASPLPIVVAAASGARRKSSEPRLADFHMHAPKQHQPLQRRRSSITSNSSRADSTTFDLPPEAVENLTSAEREHIAAVIAHANASRTAVTPAGSRRSSFAIGSLPELDEIDRAERAESARAISPGALSTTIEQTSSSPPPSAIAAVGQTSRIKTEDVSSVLTEEELQQIAKVRELIAAAEAEDARSRSASGDGRSNAAFAERKPAGPPPPPPSQQSPSRFGFGNFASALRRTSQRVTTNVNALVAVAPAAAVDLNSTRIVADSSLTPSNSLLIESVQMQTRPQIVTSTSANPTIVCTTKDQSRPLDTSNALEATRRKQTETALSIDFHKPPIDHFAPLPIQVYAVGLELPAPAASALAPKLPFASPLQATSVVSTSPSDNRRSFRHSLESSNSTTSSSGGDPFVSAPLKPLLNDDPSAAASSFANPDESSIAWLEERIEAMCQTLNAYEAQGENGDCAPPAHFMRLQKTRRPSTQANGRHPPNGVTKSTRACHRSSPSRTSKRRSCSSVDRAAAAAATNRRPDFRMRTIAKLGRARKTKRRRRRRAQPRRLPPLQRRKRS